MNSPKETSTGASAAEADIVQTSASLRDCIREELERLREEIKHDRHWMIATMLAAGVFVVGAIAAMAKLGML